jgi:hypothetical protein
MSSRLRIAAAGFLVIAFLFPLISSCSCMLPEPVEHDARACCAPSSGATLSGSCCDEAAPSVRAASVPETLAFAAVTERTVSSRGFTPYLEPSGISLDGARRGALSFPPILRI